MLLNAVKLSLSLSLSLYIYIYLCTHIYPVALRAISATVPTSFFVLACQRLHVSVDISMIIFSHGVPRWHEVTEDCVTLASVLVISPFTNL